MFKHENWTEIVALALDIGAYWMEVSGQEPDGYGDEYTTRLANAICAQDRDAVQHLTALLVVKLAARLSHIQGSMSLGTISEKWCQLFGV
jgi:hypothetical protein